MMKEFDLIRDYFTWSIEDSNVLLGVGDDAAIFSLEHGYELVTTTDTLVEGVHFSATTSAKDIAHKSLAVNLSDIAAMGAKAKYFTLALSMPKIDQSWLDINVVPAGRNSGNAFLFVFGFFFLLEFWTFL